MSFCAHRTTNFTLDGLAARGRVLGVVHHCETRARHGTGFGIPRAMQLEALGSQTGNPCTTQPSITFHQFPITPKVDTSTADRWLGMTWATSR